MKIETGRRRLMWKSNVKRGVAKILFEYVDWTQLLRDGVQLQKVVETNA
jgi:hypothetical protein